MARKQVRVTVTGQPRKRIDARQIAQILLEHAAERKDSGSSDNDRKDQDADER
ncbi:hypothetical protein SAMN05216298_4671 [Glycomyces sambucus]|uniref:Uncharacterized protein n=1 Tax=Glycomyces sambucus TaxID=380244 RepID=A0A1G9LWX2_9ACTN|nr:hypothetical protein [Glycomyces sambucus]SDL65895.1 hypothetical protein SAMN05216298_4671 [Glycomyces sambucus]